MYPCAPLFSKTRLRFYFTTVTVTSFSSLLAHPWTPPYRVIYPPHLPPLHPPRLPPLHPPRVQKVSRLGGGSLGTSGGWLLQGGADEGVWWSVAVPRGCASEASEGGGAGCPMGWRAIGRQRATSHPLMRADGGAGGTVAAVQVMAHHHRVVCIRFGGGVAYGSGHCWDGRSGDPAARSGSVCSGVIFSTFV